MLGETNPQASLPGSIRGDFSIQVGRNICHGSDSVESANHEIALWFNKNELVNWESAMYTWIYEDEPALKKPAAVSYPELSEAEKAKLNGKLLDFPYVSGYTPSQEDVFYFVQIKKVDEKLVNLARWWRNIASYENEFASLPGEPKLPGASDSSATAKTKKKLLSRRESRLSELPPTMKRKPQRKKRKAKLLRSRILFSISNLGMTRPT